MKSEVHQRIILYHMDGKDLKNERLNEIVIISLLSYTQRNFIEILLNQTEIRLYSPFSDGTANEMERFQSECIILPLSDGKNLCERE